MRTLAILGATGSIGRSTLDVVRAHRQNLRVFALTANTNWKLLAQQILEFNPAVAVLFDPTALDCLAAAIQGVPTALVTGMQGLLQVAAAAEADTLVAGLVGAIGLQPVLAAISSGKRICLANKETLVVAGSLVTGAARKHGVAILPVDSEHSAIFQCLGQQAPEAVQRLILTASGGPFRAWPPDRLAQVTPSQALHHPNWSMGGKITIDSSTMMNKGLEVIEAHWLFGIPYADIDVVVHPQSIVHSLVEFVDGSMLAQMGPPDMRFAIQYALSYPQRWTPPAPRLNLLELSHLSFEAPRPHDFPCLKLAYQAGHHGGNLPCIMNAANEVAVGAFLEQRLNFCDIPGLIAAAMEHRPFFATPTLEDLIAEDTLTRIWCREKLESGAFRPLRKAV